MYIGIKMEPLSCMGQKYMGHMSLKKEHGRSTINSTKYLRSKLTKYVN